MSVFSNLIQGWKGFFNPALLTTILSGQQASAGFATGGFALCGVFIPAAFTGTTITFLASTTLGGTYVSVENASGLVSYSVAPSQYIAINPQDFYGVAFLQIKSGSAEGASRTLTVALKGL
jgi:hypothetical protein